MNVKEQDLPAMQPALRIISAGYSTIDAATPLRDQISIANEEDEETEYTQTPQMSGRRSFGKFNKSIEVWLSNG